MSAAIKIMQLLKLCFLSFRKQIYIATVRGLSPTAEIEITETPKERMKVDAFV